MTDEQISRKRAVMRYLAIGLFFLVLAGGLFYFRFATQEKWDSYQADKQREVSLQAQVNSLTTSNQELNSIIEETGKKLVSFAEDKLKYINLASSLSVTHNCQINKLTVSDVWTEGQMSGMTATLEIQGKPTDVENFILSYCSTKYANRINSISFRPVDSYVWVSRGIDDQRVLSWFDLAEEQQKYAEDVADNRGHRMEGDVPVMAEEEEQVTSDRAITLDKMFAEGEVRAYVVVDFLGRG